MNPNPFDFLSGYKTYIVATIAILQAVAMGISNPDQTAAAITQIVIALLSMTLRHGLAKATTTVIVNAPPDDENPHAEEEAGDPLHGRKNTRLHIFVPFALAGCGLLGFTAVAQAQPVYSSLTPQPACFRIGGCPGNGGKTDPALIAALQTLAQGQQQIIQLLIAMQHPTPAPTPAPLPQAAPIAHAPPTIAYHYYLPAPNGGIPGGGAPIVQVPGGGAPIVQIPGGGSPIIQIPGGGAPIQQIPGGGAPKIELPPGGPPKLEIPGGGQPKFNEIPGGGIPGAPIPAPKVEPVPAPKAATGAYQVFTRANQGPAAAPQAPRLGEQSPAWNPSPYYTRITEDKK